MFPVLLTHLVVAKRLLCRTDLGEEPRIFIPAALDIAGEHTQQHQKPQEGIQKAQDTAHHRDQRQGQRQHIQRKDQHAQRPIELVTAITSIHKAHQRISHFVQKSHSISPFYAMERPCAPGVINHVSMV